MSKSRKVEKSGGFKLQTVFAFNSFFKVIEHDCTFLQAPVLQFADLAAIDSLNVHEDAITLVFQHCNKIRFQQAEIGSWLTATTTAS